MSPWCASCNALLDACSACGRWLLPGTTICPNPDCAAPVLPTHPTHTGRRGDGCGTPSRRLYPYSVPTVHSLNHRTLAPIPHNWQAPAGSVLHAAAVAHGFFYIWIGSGIRRIYLGSLPPDDGEELWSLGAGIGGQAVLEVPFHDRIAVVGEGVMLARRSGFAWLRVRPNETAKTIIPGTTPLTQASARGWAGWARRTADGPDALPELWLVWLQPDTGQPDPRLATLPNSGATLSPRGNIVMRDGNAWWLGTDGGMWCADIETGEVTPASPSGLLKPDDRIAASLVWVDQHQRPGFVAEVSDGASLVAWVAPWRTNEISRSPAPAGAGPLRSVHVAGDWLVVVGDQITLLNAADTSRRDVQDDGALRLPPGRWVAGCLTVVERQEAGGRPRQYPQLIVLTYDAHIPGGGQATMSLVAIDVHTGTVNSIVADILADLSTTPVGLLAAADTLYIAHTDGIVGLSWKE